MKKRTAPIGFGENPVYVTCTTDGEKDPCDRTAVWRDADGRPYGLSICYIGNRHRAHGTYWAFLPYKEDFKGGGVRMSREDVIETIENLSMSVGSYGRLLKYLAEVREVSPDKFEEIMEGFERCSSPLDLVLKIEE